MYAYRNSITSGNSCVITNIIPYDIRYKMMVYNIIRNRYIYMDTVRLYHYIRDWQRCTITLLYAFDAFHCKKTATMNAHCFQVGYVMKMNKHTSHWQEPRLHRSTVWKWTGVFSERRRRDREKLRHRKPELATSCTCLGSWHSTYLRFLIRVDLLSTIFSRYTRRLLIFGGPESPCLLDCFSAHATIRAPVSAAF
jgi:hypothetical protein